MTRALGFALCAWLVALAGACATTSTAGSSDAAAGGAADGPIAHRPPRVVDAAALQIEPPRFAETDYAFYDGNTGQQIGFDEVVARARAAQVVVVGEQHDQATHHELQRRMVATLAATPGLAVGLEMLSWEAQPALDRFNRGELSTTDLSTTVKWEKAWGFPFPLYEPIFADGLRGGARFIALNPPRELVRTLRKQGVDKLSEKDRSQLPDLDLTDTLHRAWFEGIFAQGHPIPQRDLNGFYLAQVLWDESMADGAARALQDGARQVVVLCGVGHVAMGRGVPQRIERRRPDARVLSIVPLGGVSWSDVVERLTQGVALGEGDILVVPKLDEELVL